MLAKGNSDREVCAFNLLRTVRGEVPYARLKGLNGAIIDNPASLSSGELAADAEWVLRIYEPRIQPGEITIGENNEITARIIRRGNGE